MSKCCQLFLLAATAVFLTTSVSALTAASAHVPENVANSSDFVIHGKVTDVSNQRSNAPKLEGVSTYHPVEIKIEEVFKGQIPDDTVTIHVGVGNFYNAA